MTRMKTLAALAVLAAGLPLSALAQETDRGRVEYLANCAVCHGTNGAGDGPYAELLKTPIPDLTTLSQRNDGKFPFDQVRRVIDGRADVRAHGPRDMPVWGYEYSTEVAGSPRDYYDEEQAETLVRGRILSLIDYLQGIQK